jgi:deoxyadenosine/deoxycytidine kinase
MNVYRAVMITGSPGIGKTTSAHLCAKLEGYTPIELNASDTRSKKLVEVISEWSFTFDCAYKYPERYEYQQFIVRWVDGWKRRSFVPCSLLCYSNTSIGDKRSRSQDHRQDVSHHG